MISILTRTRIRTRTRVLKALTYFPRISPFFLIILIGLSIVLSDCLLSNNALAQTQDDDSSARAQRNSSSSDEVVEAKAKKIEEEIAKEISEKITEEIEEDYNPACLELGMELYFEQKYDEAINQLEQCIPYDPDNPEIYYYIGQSYFQQGQQAAQKNNIIKATKYFRQAYPVSNTAIEKYSKKIEESPTEDHTNDYLQLAYIYQIRSLIPGVDEYQKALAIYEQLLTEKPHLTSVYYQMGWIYFQQKDYQKAIDSFLQYLKPGYRSAFVYYHLGLSYDKIGEKEQAEHYFQLILLEFPDSETASLAQKEIKKY